MGGGWRLSRFLLAALALGLPLLWTTMAGAEVDEPVGEDAKELAERHAPIFMLKDQTGACDDEGEPFAPMAVDVILDNPDVLLRQAGVADPIVKRAPNAADLHERGLGFFLDFNGLSLEPGCVYETDFDRYTGERPATVYAHVVSQEDTPGFVAVQYWSYWYYNDWNNKHESDWEFVQVLFEADSVEEALRGSPVSVGYAQHEGGERALWQDPKLQKSGDRPVVYSSAGSHASYYDATYYLGRKGTEGFGCDTTEGPSTRVEPDVVLLPDQVDDPNNPLAWLSYSGRWGERQTGPFNGPTGPASKAQWSRPMDWDDGLRSRSVSLPLAELGTGNELTRFCEVVDFASNQYRVAKVSPVRLIVVLGAVFLALRTLARRTDWSRVVPYPLVRRRRLGQILRTVLSAYSISGGALLGIASIYLPVAVAIGFAGQRWSLPWAQGLTGWLAPVLYVIATAMAALFWGSLSDTSSHPIQRILRSLLQRLPAVAMTVILGTVIVSLLTITVVGIPWAIRQYVRYQFAIQVVTLEGLSGRQALARSSELVRGRWWYTALTIGVLQALLFVTNFAMSMSLLIIFAGMPLWAFLATSFAVWGLFVPMTASAPTLLYGDAVAEHQQSPVKTRKTP